MNLHPSALALVSLLLAALHPSVSEELLKKPRTEARTIEVVPKSDSSPGVNEAHQSKTLVSKSKGRRQECQEVLGDGRDDRRTATEVGSTCDTVMQWPGS